MDIERKSKREIAGKDRAEQGNCENTGEREEEPRDKRREK